MDRMKVIENAAFEFGANRGNRAMFACKSAWVNGALIDAGLTPLSDAERKAVDSPDSPDPEKVAAVTNRAGQEWDQQGASLQCLCSREAFVQESLREAGLVQVIV